MKRRCARLVIVGAIACVGLAAAAVGRSSRTFCPACGTSTAGPDPAGGALDDMFGVKHSPALRAIDPVWDVLLAEEQRRIVQLLIEDITISTSGIDIRFRTNGIEQIV